MIKENTNGVNTSIQVYDPIPVTFNIIPTIVTSKSRLITRFSKEFIVIDIG
jgi:hypothetical protein